MAQSPNEAPLDPLTGLPKEVSSRGPPSPPPAYCPPARHLRQQPPNHRGITDNSFRALGATQDSELLRIMNNARAIEYSNLDDEVQDDDEHSPIQLQIDSTLHIVGDNNAIVVTRLPAEHAKGVAEAVTATIRQASSMNGGIPMIDEEGRPRPFRITVAAGMHIEGSGNVLGNAEHVMKSLGRKRKRDHRGGDGDGGGGGGDGVVADKGSDDAAPPPRRLRR
ncbi:hypothetical protein diail_9367 [Diaporthe ilicicola]|nr:hypothetical protein diail_9367 [Diaporthe ilicicola]